VSGITQEECTTMSIWPKIKKWYAPNFVVIQDDHPSMPSTKLIDQSAPSAQFARKLGTFCSKHWQWLIGTSVVIILGIAGLYLSFLALTKDRPVKEKSREPSRNHQNYKI
jgi:hypothetical protein